MNSLPLDPHALISAMKETSTFHLYEEVVLHYMRISLQSNILPTFIQQVQNDDFESVHLAVKNLYESMCWFYDYVSFYHKAEELKMKMNSMLAVCLRWQMKDGLMEAFRQIFSFSLQFFLHDHGHDSFVDEDDNDRTTALYFKDKSMTVNVAKFKHFQETNFVPMVQKWLVDLNLVKMFCEDVVVSILQTEMDRYVVKTCGKQYEQSWLGDEKDILGNWTKSHVLPWLEMVFHYQFNRTDWEEKLLYILYNSYTNLRISEMLNIIKEYPDSIPVLHDLKLCLQHTRLRPCLIKSLKQDIRSRVLHPGVSTQNIITIYIAAVKALRELDISGVVMEMVLETCTNYLTQREDSVRLIMQGLLWDDGSNDLAAELANNEKSEAHPFANERVTKEPEDWMPDPREADPKKSNTSTRTSDIVTLFIGMYGSKEKFIKEYQKLLSKRLLHTWSSGKNETAEIRNLELLKKRFGEDDMSKCSVMLKDIADSRRINTNIKEEKAKKSENFNFDLRAMIVSSEFWPEITNQDFEMPPALADTFRAFNKGYESLKASRSLSWLNSVGMVDMELELEDRIVEVKATPLQAAILWCFQDKDMWNLDELGDHLKIPPTILRRKMTYWVQQGILKHVEPDNYLLIEKRDVTSSSTRSRKSEGDTERIWLGSFYNEEDEEDNIDGDDEEKQHKNEQMLWNYVQGMLRNIDSVPLERIHKMLQLFVMHDANVQIELPQLRDMLNSKVQKGLLVLEQGKYKLVRDTT